MYIYRVNQRRSRDRGSREIPEGDQRARAFAPTLGLGPPKGASTDRLSGAGASAGICRLPWGSAV